MYSVYGITCFVANMYNSVRPINTVALTLLPCRRCCRRPSGLLADQWTVQTAASDHNGAHSPAAAEALQ